MVQPRRPAPALALGSALALALAGCGGDDGAPAPQPGVDTTVTALDGVHVYFTPENHRVVDVPVTFPAAGLRYSTITLRLGLRCPSPGGCDFWDRLGRISILQPPTTGTDPVELEVARFITPYRVGGAFTVDVTDLQRVLEGPQTVRVFIDTWVGPGHAQGAGWLVDAAFDYVGGLPAQDPIAVLPLWAPHRLVYGDPARPLDAEATAMVPAGATATRVRALVTGHGQGNADNCAEFCAKDHVIAVGAATTTARIWRDDCRTTAAPNQQGTWQYPRAGWCPGAMVTPWTVDGAATAGPLTIGYDVAPYENTCRPDAPTCGGCTLGTGCPYNDGSHTEPGWEQSAVLIVYR